MKKSIGSVFLAFVFLAILLSGCAPASTPVPSTSTPSPIPPTFTPSPIPPTSTPPPTLTREPTATPAFTIECSLIKVDIQKSHPANVYGAFGQFYGTGTQEVAALQIDITGESGQVTSSGTVTNELDAQHTLILVKIDDELTYSDSKNTYKVIGTIAYEITTGLGTLHSYDIMVTDDGSGTTSQKCKKPAG